MRRDLPSSPIISQTVADGYMLRTALDKWKAKVNEDPYSVLQGDALHMPFKDGSFDRAMVAFGIRNMVDIDHFLGEVHRVLRPGGRLAVVEMSVPRFPVVREVFLFYLTRVMPLAVRMQKGDASSYRYLCDSIITFPEPKVLEGMDVTDLRAVDHRMIELDGTPNKSKLGANATVAVSLAVAKAGAEVRCLPLHEHLRAGSHA